MKCPHCQTEIHENYNEQYLGKDSVSDWVYRFMQCPQDDCQKFILKIAFGEKNTHNGPLLLNEKSYFAIPFDPYEQYYDLSIMKFYKDYLEAKAIQNISPKASILLSKDCLKKLLKIQIYSQSEAFEDVLADLLNQDKLPLFIFASTEAILTMNSEDSKEFAHSLINYIEGLFDYFYVLPNKMKVL